MGLLPEAAETRALISLLLLVVGTVLAVMALRNRRWEVPAAVVATAGVVSWTFASDEYDYDGPVVLVVVEGSGVHVGDLLSVPALVLVLWLIYRGWRR